jgi:hypothetical protein
MMRAAAALLLVMAASLAVSCNAAAASSLKRVYRIDSCAATIDGNEISVIASGATATGGWTNAQLRQRRAPRGEKNILVFELVATPPAPKKAVVQTVVPVNAKLSMRVPHGPIKQIEIDAEMNSSIAQVIGR